MIDEILPLWHVASINSQTGQSLIQKVQNNLKSMFVTQFYISIFRILTSTKVLSKWLHTTNSEQLSEWPAENLVGNEKEVSSLRRSQLHQDDHQEPERTLEILSCEWSNSIDPQVIYNRMWKLMSALFSILAHQTPLPGGPVSYTHLTLPTNREV